MGLLNSLSDWIGQGYDEVKNANPLEGKLRPSPSQNEIQDKSVMAPLASKDAIKSEPVRSTWDEIVFQAKELWNSAQEPGKVIPWLAEQAINPLTYLSPPAKALGAAGIGAGLIGALTKAGMLKPSIAMDMANQVGAFRPTNSKLLPSTLQPLIDRTRNADILDLTKDPDYGILVGKLSAKEVSKYGTPDFLLDKYLSSTRFLGGEMDAVEQPLSEFLKTPGMQELANMTQSSKRDNAAGDTARGYLSSMVENKSSIYQDIRAYRDQIKDKIPLWKEVTKRNEHSFYDDIATGFDKLEDVLYSSPLTKDQLAKKSLSQLVSHADEILAQQERDKAAALLEKEAFIPLIKQRTLDLQKEQGLQGSDFVELTTPQDMSADTSFLNNCVGSAGNINGVFKSAFHPVTGKQLVSDSEIADSHFKVYNDKVQNGDIRLFSYRPNGLPEATIHIGAETGRIYEALGKDNEALHPDIMKKVEDFISSFKNSAYNVDWDQFFNPF